MFSIATVTSQAQVGCGCHQQQTDPRLHESHTLSSVHMCQVSHVPRELAAAWGRGQASSPLASFPDPSVVVWERDYTTVLITRVRTCRATGCCMVTLVRRKGSFRHSHTSYASVRMSELCYYSCIVLRLMVVVLVWERGHGSTAKAVATQVLGITLAA